MNRTARNIALAAIAVVFLAATGWVQARGSAPADRLLVSGSVRPDTRVVSAPALSYPAPDYTVGIPRPSGSSASGARKASGSSGARTGQPIVAGMLKLVSVREGDRVKTGQLVAEFEPAMLELGVDQAKAAEVRARRDVNVLRENLDDLDEARHKLTDARAKLATAKATLLKARTALIKARKQLLSQQKELRAARAQQPQLEAALAALKAQAGAFPPGQVPAALQKQIAEITGLLASIDPGLAKIARGLATVNTNLAKVNRGLSALPAARAKIASAEAKLDEAEAQLRDAKDVLGIVADGQSVTVRLAKVRRSQAALYSPVDGTVTFTRRAGSVAMVGAPVVRIHPDGPQRVDTYLTAEQVVWVAVGSEADLTFDSAPGEVLHGRISEIGSAYVFPPTSFPTQIVHMTRALKVTIQLDDGAQAPPGTPVDISIRTNTNR